MSVSRFERALDGRIVSCLEWASEVIASSSDSPAYWQPDDDEAVRPLDKMLSEAALLAMISQRAIGRHPSIDRLLAAVVGCSESLDRTYELVRWHPYLWTSVGAIWVILDELDVGDPVKRARLRRLWNDDRAPQPRERVPYRLLDQAWIRGIAQGHQDFSHLGDVVRSSSFAGVTGGIFMATSDLYAVTHTPMYITDFGRLGQTEVQPGWMAPLGLYRLLLNDLDLAGEFAIADCLTRSPPDTGTVAIAAALSSIFDHFGFIPAPTFRNEAFEQTGLSREYLCFHTYHSTFVYGLLCSVLRILNVSDVTLTTIMSAHSPRIPCEWNGNRLGMTEVHERVTFTVENWYGLISDRGADVDTHQLLRTVLDAYLLDTVISEKTDEALSLLGMASYAGPSSVDSSVRALFAMRGWLGGVEVFADALPS